MCIKRRGRKVSEKLTPKEKMASSLDVKDSFTPHKPAKPGVTCIASFFDTQSNNDYLLTGGVDKDVLLSASKNGSFKVVSKLVGHDKKVDSVAFHPSSLNTIYSASSDNTIKVWTGDSEKGYSNAVTFDLEDLTAMAVHPTGKFLVSTSKNGSWNFLDVDRGISLKTIYGFILFLFLFLFLYVLYLIIKYFLKYFNAF